MPATLIAVTARGRAAKLEIKVLSAARTGLRKRTTNTRKGQGNSEAKIGDNQCRKEAEAGPRHCSISFPPISLFTQLASVASGSLNLQRQLLGIYKLRE